MKKITDVIKKRFVFFDGGIGTVLQSWGLKSEELPESWNITHKDKIIQLHKDYIKSGSDIITTNTFGANILKFSETECEKIITAAIENAKEAIKCNKTNRDIYIAYDIGPLGKLLKPFGDFDFEEVIKIFSFGVRVAEKCGADLIIIETMNDSYETKAAVLAAKENSTLPIFVTNAYDETSKLITGANPQAMVALLEGLGVDALGINCSLGPDKMKNTIKQLIKYSSIPVIVNPNAGLPKIENGITVFDITVDDFAKEMTEIAQMGASILGGCCGTTPEHISLMKKNVSECKFMPVKEKKITMVSSYTHAVVFADKPVLIGERINPTGKKKFKEALKNNDINYTLNEGLSQQEKGAHILDVNVGLPEIDETQMLAQAIREIQSIIDLPLQIDTGNYEAMEKAMRIYNGKPMVNSVNGKKESMEKIFPLVKKYGGVVVALTLDENAIPSSSQGRFEIAEKIYNEAQKYGISPKNIIIDPLAMAVSADNTAATITLETINLIKKHLAGKTSLGISNISFGMPSREALTSSFFTMALSSGLDAAIMNPYSEEMMKAYHSYCVLAALDENCTEYINYFSVHEEKKVFLTNEEISLKTAIKKGLREKSKELTHEMKKDISPLEIINNHIIPALNEVGKGFEEKTVFLPQLLMSAEAAKSSFEAVRATMEKNDTTEDKKCTVVIATVKGDIHDIGKNIVKVLLENYNFNVIDLGKNVNTEVITETVIKEKAPLVGLSALMTTTVISMEETIKALHKTAPWCKIVVGGAVLTEEYSKKIGADKYAKDAMETVRYAQKINNSI